MVGKIESCINEERRSREIALNGFELDEPSLQVFENKLSLNIGIMPVSGKLEIINADLTQM